MNGVSGTFSLNDGDIFKHGGYFHKHGYFLEEIAFFPAMAIFHQRS